MGNMKGLSRKLQENRGMYGKYLGHILEICGKIYGKYAEHIWEIFGKPLGHIWENRGIYGKYMGHIRKHTETYGKHHQKSKSDGSLQFLLLNSMRHRMGIRH